MRYIRMLYLVTSMAVGLGWSGIAQTAPVYWNLFNLEGESSLDSIYVTYDSQIDMLTDSNRTGSFVPNTTGISAQNVVGSGSDGATYWNLFNLEGESGFDAIYVTYGTLIDMLTDSNRTGSFVPNTTGASAENVVGSGSDGATYWSLFNLEGESSLDAIYVTYGSLTDMLTDSNRTGSFVPNTTGASAQNVVGSGSDGATYWNLFNLEGESSLDAIYVTYGSLADMLIDSNRTGSFVPNTTGASARNVVGSGASIFEALPPGSVPEPGSVGLVALALMCLSLVRKTHRADGASG
ncbi:PEP-CTERM sorting domain-containing protein [Denitromonas halophila]|nr:PEP-CTERM sorting domain-containing protein [Denitromonas halophila]